MYKISKNMKLKISKIYYCAFHHRCTTAKQHVYRRWISVDNYSIT